MSEEEFHLKIIQIVTDVSKSARIEQIERDAWIAEQGVIKPRTSYEACDFEDSFRAAIAEAIREQLADLIK